MQVGQNPSSMSSHGGTLYDNFFSSLISDIKAYEGTDPLLPWLRGIRKMKDSLPPQLVKEKLPRFLQKCSETFLTDRRYSNDLRYLRVWLQLMDFVDDPKAILRKMEMNRIGSKRSLFYQAYALYYEKLKKFDAADQIYHLGVQNLAEPADDLQRSYEQFLHRKRQHKNKRIQRRKASSIPPDHDALREHVEDSYTAKVQLAKESNEEYLPERQAKFADIENMRVSPSPRLQYETIMKEANYGVPAKLSNIHLVSDHLSRKMVVDVSEANTRMEKESNTKLCKNDTVVLAMSGDTTIVEKFNAKDTRHPGGLERTIYKQSENSHNLSMPQAERLETDVGESKLMSSENLSMPQAERDDVNQHLDEPFEIYVDGADANYVKEEVVEKAIPAQKFSRAVVSSSQASAYERLNDAPSKCFNDMNHRRVNQAGFSEDTVVYSFVGSTISDEPQVENVWHHGLVDPTINLKEAMEDINSMFGRPIEFQRKSRTKKQDKACDIKNNLADFLILPDDEFDNRTAQDGDGDLLQNLQDYAFECSPKKLDRVPTADGHASFLILPDDEFDNQCSSSQTSSPTGGRSDLCEQTLCTKEAMAEMNKLFAMPMDF